VFEQPNGPGFSGIKQRAWARRIRGYSMDFVSSICGNCNAQKILHIAGHHLYNAAVGGFYRGVRADEGSAGGILFFESKGIQSFF